MSIKLNRSPIPLSIRGVTDTSISEQVMKTFDLTNRRTDFFPWEIDGVLPHTWRCGLVVGASGTGKSTLLKSLGDITYPDWHPNRDIASHFETAGDAASRLNAAGLNSIPTWLKPYRVLSTGERFRADLARSLTHGALIDEYTSTVSRIVAQSASRSLHAWMARNPSVSNLVLATCHYDVIDWLQPDWVIDTDAGTFTEMTSGSRKPETWWMELVSHKDGEIGCN